MRLIGDAARLVVRVAVVGAVAELLHERRRRVADHERRRQAAAPLDLLARLPEPEVHRVALGRGGQVHGALGDRQLALRRAELVVRLERRDRDRERLRVGIADVLAGEADETARNVERVLPAASMRASQ